MTRLVVGSLFLAMAVALVPATTALAAPPAAPVIGAPFSATHCADAVLADPLTSITIEDWWTPSQDPITLDLEIYDLLATPGVDPPVIQLIDFPQALVDGPTVLPTDGTLLQDCSRYLVRAQRKDTGISSAWSECDFLLHTSNCAPGAITILSPTVGTVFPAGTEQVDLVVQNPTNTLRIAVCASSQPTFGDCDASPANWQLAASTGVPSETSTIPLTRLADGALIFTAEEVHVTACALDDLDECGPADGTWFSIEPNLEPPLSCDQLRCPSDYFCDSEPSRCIPLEEPNTPSGGCASGVSNSSRWGALLLLLALPLLRRRSSSGF